MQVTFWNFNKKANSKKRPVGQGIELTAIYYKEITDINNPALQIHTQNFNNNLNYAKIGNKYYFVNNVEAMVNNMWRVQLRIDLLATYKSEILNTTAFVARASNGYNKYLIDDFNTVGAKVNRTVLQADYVPFYETGEGCYILEVINSLTGTVTSGFNAAYILTAEQMQEVSSKLMTDNGLIEELKKTFQAPIESIISCHWMPLNYEMTCVQNGALATKVYLGSYDTGINGYLVGSNFMETHSDFDLTQYIPDNYLRNPKYTDILMCLPYVGTVSIDTRQMIEASNGSVESCRLRVRICIDVRSGKQLVMIVPQAYPNAPINTYETVIYEDRPISSAASNIAPTLYSVAAAIPMAGMGGGWLAGSLASVSTALVESFRTNYSSVGTSGGSAFEGYGTACRCIIIQREKSFEPEDETVKQTIGLPVNKPLLLSTLGSGFVQTINVSVSISDYYDNTLAVNNLLNGGIYIE